MSLLSQFFPSGGGAKIAIDMLAVGGGGGGTPSFPLASVPLPFPSCGPSVPCLSSYCSIAIPGGGGGGGGEVYSFHGFPVNSGSTITVTIGSGGAVNSSGGNSCICISNQNNIVVNGGIGCANALTCSCLSSTDYVVFGNRSFGGGMGLRGTVCMPPGGFYPGLGPILSPLCQSGCNNGGLNYKGLSSLTDCPTNAPGAARIYHQVENGFIIRGRGFPGAYAPTKPLNYMPSGGSPGAGGGGGGGSTGSGMCGTTGNYNPYMPPVNCPAQTRLGLAGNGGSGGTAFCSSILGTCIGYGAGGGGGGGRLYLLPGGYVPGPQIPAVPTVNRGTGGYSPNGGRGGSGGISNGPLCTPNCNGCNGNANTGGGGGGGGGGNCIANQALNNVCSGGSGGSGVVIIQYPTAYPVAPTAPGATICSPSTPGCHTYVFNGPGSITLP